MNRETATELLAAVLLLAVVFQTVQIAGMSDRIGKTTGQVVAAAPIPTGGPYQGYATYEEMMAAHHGGTPQAAPASGGLNLPQQQGGC